MSTACISVSFGFWVEGSGLVRFSDDPFIQERSQTAELRARALAPMPDMFAF